ncbi:uncharacterized protein LOC141911651 [Tubulanus polymorphus]|uniref:uncharacterized protein LOC141911651 n=1 Tax=Tubulanus polymorphus TaxID=672921 RepID=UPI003DA60102
MSQINLNSGNFVQQSQSGIPLTSLPLTPAAASTSCNIAPTGTASSMPVVLSLNLITDTGNNQVQTAAPITLQSSHFNQLNDAQNITGLIGGTGNSNMQPLQSLHTCRLAGLTADNPQSLVQIGGVASQAPSSHQLNHQLCSILAPFVSAMNSAAGAAAQTAPNTALANLLQLASTPSTNLIHLANSVSNLAQPVSSSNQIHLASTVSSLANILQQTNHANPSTMPQITNTFSLGPSLTNPLLDILTVGPGNVLQLNTPLPTSVMQKMNSKSSETQTFKSALTENIESSSEDKTRRNPSPELENLVSSTDEVSSTTTTNLESQTCQEVAEITAQNNHSETAVVHGQLDPECSAALSSVLELILKSPTMELADRGGTPSSLQNVPEESSSISPCEPETTIQTDDTCITCTTNELSEWLYCVDCNDYISNGCETHPNGYEIIDDKPILSRARMSIPLQLYLKETTKHTGVWAQTDIGARTRFGPLIGELIDKLDTGKHYRSNSKIWQLFTTDGQCVKMVNCTNEDKSNWMSFVRAAEKQTQQNIVVYQENDKIYFVTCKNILADTELRLWYSKNYALCLGLPVSPDDMKSCRQCSKICIGSEELRDHMVSVHGRAMSKWQCMVCNRLFSSSTKLQNHVNTHMNMKPYECSMCDKAFNDPSNLRMHLKIHTGDKRFKCNVCDKRFTQKAHLDMHQVVHTKEKSLSCEYCGKMFARKSDLRVHEYQHTKERIYVCDNCPKIFYKLQNYKRHMNIHLGVKDFVCARCSKKFSTKFHLTRHEKSCKMSLSEVIVSSLQNPTPT